MNREILRSFGCQLMPSEKRMLKELAKREGVSMSKMVRLLIQRAADRHRQLETYGD